MTETPKKRYFKGSATPGLKMARVRKFWTQEDLERASGVEQATISALETGRRGAYTPTLKALCEALEVDVDELLFDPEMRRQHAS